MVTSGLTARFLRRSGACFTAALTVFFLAALPLAAQWDDGPGEVPYVPTPQEVVDAMLKLGGVTSTDVVFDLGCGDGRIVVTAAQKHQARATGIDINPVRIQEATENAKNAGVTAKVRFIEQNLFDADVREASVVTLYLLPDVNIRLRPILLRDLKVGSRIVSHSFDMGEWEPDKKVDVNGRTIYLWSVTRQAKEKFAGPPRTAGIDGEWILKVPMSGAEIEVGLTLKADGKRLTGAFLFPENRKFDIQDGTVEGSQFNCIVRRERGQGVAVYKVTGTVNGDEIRGTTRTEWDGETVNLEWTARRK